MLKVLILAASMLLPAIATAHSSSSAFFYWDAADSRMRLDVALSDLQRLVQLDENRDGELYWQDILSHQQLLNTTLASHVAVQSGGSSCETRFIPTGVAQYGDGGYVSFLLKPSCASPTSLEYGLFRSVDTEHRLLAHLSRGGEQIVVVDPADAVLDLSGSQSTASVFSGFVYQGMLHLWFGYDHVLFLLTLLLALCYEARKPTGGMAGRVVILKRALAVVTAFTVAHSLTLVASSLGWLSFPIRWIEALIAASITVAAINVFWPIFSRRTYLLAFVFGLIHGFGFSSVLADLLDSSGQQVVALAGFNIGVELAQAALVVVLLPLLLWLMQRRLFNQFAAPAMVMAISALGMMWTVERALW